MSALEEALVKISRAENYAGSPESCLAEIDGRAKLLVTVLFIVAVLALPLRSPDRLLLFAIYPVVSSALAGVEYWRVLVYSLAVVPLAAAIGAFNPLLDRATAFYVGPVAVSGGWASFATIVLRALLAAQALLVLIYSTGFRQTCRSMQRLGVPAVMASLMLFVYRYVAVLLREAVTMDRARRSRGFGRRHYPLRLWAVLVGQLLMRSVDRAERVQRAMEARGYTGGSLVAVDDQPWTLRSALYLAAWCAFFALAWWMPLHRIFAF